MYFYKPQIIKTCLFILVVNFDLLPRSSSKLELSMITVAAVAFLVPSNANTHL